MSSSEEELCKTNIYLLIGPKASFSEVFQFSIFLDFNQKWSPKQSNGDQTKATEDQLNLDGWGSRWMDGWMDGGQDRWMDGWVDVWWSRWMAGWGLSATLSSKEQSPYYRLKNIIQMNGWIGVKRNNVFKRAQCYR